MDASSSLRVFKNNIYALKKAYVVDESHGSDSFYY